MKKVEVRVALTAAQVLLKQITEGDAEDHTPEAYKLWARAADAGADFDEVECALDRAVDKVRS